MTADTALRITSGLMSAAAAIIGYIVVGKPEDYGLSPVTVHWLSAILVGLGVVGPALPGWVKGVAQAAKNSGVGER